MQKGKRNKSLSFLNKSTLKNFLRIISILKKPEIYIVLGLILISLGAFYHINEARRPAFSGPIPQASNVFIDSNPPKRILIPSSEIDLPIEQTIIEGDKWQISEIGVSHLESSANLGSTGNIILYGHNTKDRLGNLRKVKKGDKIFLYSEGNTSYVYTVVSLEIVEPTQVDKLLEFDGQMISIYTCTGFADLKRLIVKAKLLDSLTLK